MTFRFESDLSATVEYILMSSLYRLRIRRRISAVRISLAEYGFLESSIGGSDSKACLDFGGSSSIFLGNWHLNLPKLRLENHWRWHVPSLKTDGHSAHFCVLERPFQEGLRSHPANPKIASMNFDIRIGCVIEPKFFPSGATCPSLDLASQPRQSQI